MHLFKFDSLDRAVLELLRSIDEEGDEAAPRGMRTKELLNVCFKLTNPRARLVLNEERRWSFPLAVGEFLWHFAGRNDSPSISHYAPRWADFSHDGVIPSSCYGFKIFRSEDGRPSQWSLVSNLLKSDPSTRRAVINLYDADEDLQPDAADVACASTLQFFVREGKLHLTTYMRSNDAIWGLPYDCFIMTMLQESLAKQLGYPLGEYVHYAASLHVYERHFPLVERMLAAVEESENASMPPMPGAVPADSLFSYEKLIREKEPVLDFADLPIYWKDLLLVLSFHKAHQLDHESRKREIIAEISEGAYKHLLRKTLPSTVTQRG
jgi:thymidylate synthase